MYDATRDIVGAPVIFKGVWIERGNDQTVVNDLHGILTFARVVDQRFYDAMEGIIFSAPHLGDNADSVLLLVDSGL